MKTALRNGLAWPKAAIIGALSSWLIGTSVMVSAMLLQIVLGTGSLDGLLFIIVLGPIVGALLFPGALILGGAAGCLALRTARSTSPRAHTAGIALLGAVIGLVYATVLLSVHTEIEVVDPSWLFLEAFVSGAIAGAVISALVRKKVEG